MFDLRKIRLAVGDQHREEIAVTIRPFRMGGVDYEPVTAADGTAPAQFAVTRLRSGYVFDLRFDVRAVGPCHRCLEDAAVDLVVRAEEYHAFNPEPGAEVDMTSEYLDDEVVDTDRWASDATVLAMPFQILCREDCAGLCPQCGSNRNDGSCDCGPGEPDARWAALRDLQLPE